MDDRKKTKKQLIQELEQSRRELKKLALAVKEVFLKADQTSREIDDLRSIVKEATTKVHRLGGHLPKRIQY